MSTLPKLGDKFWCIGQDIEALSNNDELPPARPWRGVVTAVFLDCHPQMVDLSRFSTQTGEPDTDTNATAMVTVYDLFQSEQDALRAFADKIVAYCEYKKAQLDNEKRVELEYANKKRKEFLGAG